MLVVFEGIDGSGKTTLSNRVVARLRKRGLTVKHLRADGKFASPVTEAIRSLGRDARNIDLDPKAEFLLYVTREVQNVEEVLKPALLEHDVVVADRFFPTAEVIGRYGRRLPEAWTQPILTTAASGIEPELYVLVDVDPALARARRKAHKLTVSETKPPSRRGLAGVGLQHRLREGYLALARERSERWVRVDNESAPLDETVVRVSDLIEDVRNLGASKGIEGYRSRMQPLANAGVAPARDREKLRTPADALERFMQWVNQRAVIEPLAASYMLSGLSGAAVDSMRESLSERVPDVALIGVSGLTDEVSWRIRERLAPAHAVAAARSLTGISNLDERARNLRYALCDGARAPREVLQSLARQDDDHAWALRSQWLGELPDAVMRSLRGLDTARAWEQRERWLAAHSGRLGTDYDVACIAAASVTGLNDDRAWAVRRAIWPVAPVAALESIAGLGSERSWEQRDKYLVRAPKIVMGTLRSMRDPRAWSMRQAVAADCKEAIDSIPELDEPEAWALRDNYADIWPSTAVKTLGRLADSQRGQAYVERQLAAHANNISLLKHTAAIALGVHWFTARELEAQPEGL
ncbi:MAG: hypothetical protein RL701_7234 [Pseudomonadota bacterium]